MPPKATVLMKSRANMVRSNGQRSYRESQSSPPAARCGCVTARVSGDYQTERAVPTPLEDLELRTQKDFEDVSERSKALLTSDFKVLTSGRPVSAACQV